MPDLLIVDDSVSVRKALERILQGQNIAVTSAESAEQALERLNEQTFDIVIADIVMPGMDGFELCRVLKADERFSNLPVILISGIVNAAVSDQAADVGAVDVIKKPFNPNDLIPQINQVLKDSPSEPREPSVSISVAQESGDELEDVLRPFLDKADIDTVLLIDKGGDCLVSIGNEVAESATLASYFKFYTSAAGVMGTALNAGFLQNMYLEYEGACLLLHRVAGGFGLVLVMGSSSGQNVARFVLKKQLPELERLLQDEATAA